MWWKYAIGYQIYPASFCDSNHDGIGDIQGIISKLDYLQDLGVTLLWVCPFFDSPMDDNGYDIRDHRRVNAIFGANEDLELLINAVHQRKMRIICDLVLNHTSDEHPWFIESKDASSEKHDYYIWREGKPNNPPNNWASFFSQSAWTYDAQRDASYLRIFSGKMPDLNWENRNVRSAMADIARFWLDKGMDGFRMDAISHLAKDQTFADSTLPLNIHGYAPDWDKFSNRERLFDYLHEFQAEVFDNRDALRIGEVGGCASLEMARRFTSKDEGCFDMIFSFDHCWENDSYGNDTQEEQKFTVNTDRLKRTFEHWYQGMNKDRWQAVYWLNHDHPRVLSHYGDDTIYRNEAAKMLCNTLYFMMGTPFIYNGEEIGMSNVDYKQLTDFKDISAENYIASREKSLSQEKMLRFLKRASRVNARTPMQWDDSAYAGFSDVAPWTKVNGNYKEVNVAAEQKDPHSILNHYKAMIRLRKEPLIEDLVLFGTLTFIDIEHKDIFAYRKQSGDKALVVISNFKAFTVVFSYDYPLGMIMGHNYETVQWKAGQFILRPYESLVMIYE